MRLKQVSILVMIMVLGISALAGAHGTGSDHTHTENEDGIEAAKVWLSFVDRQKYNASWQTAAAYLKAAVTQEQWEQTVTAVRQPIGALIQRHLFHDRYTTTLPGMPDGEYIVLRFISKFENKQSAVETVTLMKDDSDTWRAAGYFIK